MHMVVSLPRKTGNGMHVFRQLHNQRERERKLWMTISPLSSCNGALQVHTQILGCHELICGTSEVFQSKAIVVFHRLAHGRLTVELVFCILCLELSLSSILPDMPSQPFIWKSVATESEEVLVRPSDSANPSKACFSTQIFTALTSTINFRPPYLPKFTRSISWVSFNGRADLLNLKVCLSPELQGEMTKNRIQRNFGGGGLQLVAINRHVSILDLFAVSNKLQETKQDEPEQSLSVRMVAK